MSSAYGIEDGQRILFLRSAFDDPGAATPMTLNLRATAPASASAFYFSVPCWSATLATEPTLRITGFAGCKGKTTFDAYVFAIDTSGSVLAYGALLDQPYEAGGSRDLALDANSAAITRQTIQVSPIADSSSKLSVFMLGYREGDFERSATTGLRFETRMDPSGSSRNVELPWPSGRFHDYNFGARIELERDGLRRFTSFERFVTSPPRSFEFDPSALAELDLLDVGTDDPQHPVVRWTLSRVGRLGDAVKLSAGWSGSDSSTLWAISAPPNRSGSVRLFDLPVRFRDFAPSSGVSYGTLSARHFDDLARDGYGDYLATRSTDDASNVDSSTARR
jgi:hypothetical protein